jgi:hypothetical protein
LYKIASSEPSSPEEAWLEVWLLGEDGQSQNLISASELWQAADWDLISKDLSEWQGETVTLQFQVVRCSEKPFSVSVDRVSVGLGK